MALCLQDSEENKLVYTDVFCKYTELLESIIEKRLRQAVPGFDMQVRPRRGWKNPPELY